jgi:hypothetical protein
MIKDYFDNIFNIGDLVYCHRGFGKIEKIIDSGNNWGKLVLKIPDKYQISYKRKYHICPVDAYKCICLSDNALSEAKILCEMS